MISRNFTIEDIHQIRYENYEQIKDLSPAQIIARTREKALEGWQKIEEIRMKKGKRP